MNTTRITTLIAAAGLVAGPAIASASNQQLALDSCAKALVASIASKYPKPLKLREPHDPDGGTLVADHYEFVVVARRATDNAPLGRALCRTDDNDRVVELTAEPLSAAVF